MTSRRSPSICGRSRRATPASSRASQGSRHMEGTGERQRERLALTRFAILRLLGVVYACAFLVLWFQAVPLFGHDGLTPADQFLEQVRAGGHGFWKLPSLFWLGISDGLIRALAAAGLVLSVLCALGFTNSIALLLLCALYLSFLH